jgi:hypothetical protein
VRLMTRAFCVGYPYGVQIHRDPAYEGMKGYTPWANLVRPKP